MTVRSKHRLRAIMVNAAGSLRMRVVDQQKKCVDVQHGKVQEEREPRNGVVSEVRSEIYRDAIERVEQRRRHLLESPCRNTPLVQPKRRSNGLHLGGPVESPPLSAASL